MRMVLLSTLAFAVVRAQNYCKLDGEKICKNCNILIILLEII